jgi:U3 small nucleolar RNA-associated protein 14
VHNDPHGVTLLEDVVRREANRAMNERHRTWKQRRLRSTARAATEAHGEGTPSESESSGDSVEDEDEDGEGEIISPPQSPPPESLLSLGDLFGWQMGIAARVS